MSVFPILFFLDLTLLLLDFHLFVVLAGCFQNTLEFLFEYLEFLLIFASQFFFDFIIFYTISIFFMSEPFIEIPHNPSQSISFFVQFQHLLLIFFSQLPNHHSIMFLTFLQLPIQILLSHNHIPLRLLKLHLQFPHITLFHSILLLDALHELVVGFAVLLVDIILHFLQDEFQLLDLLVCLVLVLLDVGGVVLVEVLAAGELVF